MNVFVILSILIIVIGVLLLVATPSTLFKLNWNEKTGKEKILMFIFYSILVYIINIIYWIIKSSNNMWTQKNLPSLIAEYEGSTHFPQQHTMNVEPKRIKYLKKINKNPQKKEVDFVDWAELIINLK